MSLALELGQITDPAVRRAFEQVSLRWLDGMPVGAVIAWPPGMTLPPGYIDTGAPTRWITKVA